MTIGIIAAMDKEIKKYQEIFDLEKTNKLLDIYEGNYQDKKIVLCLSGIGKVNSAATTQYLIDKYNPSIIINSGCAGSLTENVKVLDTIVASFVTYHDFSPIRIMESCVPDNGLVKTDIDIIEKVETLLKEENIKYHIGGIASGDCFVTSSNMRDDIYSKTNCLAVDMESASIGHISKKNNVPFIIIRSISDFADGATEQEEQAANISALITQKYIDKI